MLKGNLHCTAYAPNSIACLAVGCNLKGNRRSYDMIKWDIRSKILTNTMGNYNNEYLINQLYFRK